MSSEESDQKSVIKKKEKKIKASKEEKEEKDEILSEKKSSISIDPKENSPASHTASHSESNQNDNEQTKKLKLEIFLNKVNQNSRGRKKIKKNNSFDKESIDTPVSEQLEDLEIQENYAKEQIYKNRKKLSEEELQEFVNEMMMKMKVAEQSDQEANSHCLPAFAKLELIDKEISQALKNVETIFVIYCQDLSAEAIC